MIKDNEPIAYSDNHEYYIVLKDRDNNSYLGKAVCCEADYDFESEKIGYTIAHARASIKLAKAEKRNIQYELKSLKQLYYSINRSKHFDKKHYEVKMLFRQIKQREYELEAINEIIKDIRISINKYISDKNDFHASIKEAREKKANS